ncbi:unnamed protein product [Citrullus colocynthis]|uniref:Uncharacterized protein n=1 Tax=Citrullus colocynthis TaxID=252529 RepID=A0ABP0ZH30_9ROSI
MVNQCSKVSQHKFTGEQQSQATNLRLIDSLFISFNPVPFELNFSVNSTVIRGREGERKEIRCFNSIPFPISPFEVQSRNDTCFSSIQIGSGWNLIVTGVVSFRFSSTLFRLALIIFIAHLSGGKHVNY